VRSQSDQDRGGSRMDWTSRWWVPKWSRKEARGQGVTVHLFEMRRIGGWEIREIVARTSSRSQWGLCVKIDGLTVGRPDLDPRLLLLVHPWLPPPPPPLAPGGPKTPLYR